METGQSVSPKYFYILNVANGTITHGPMKSEEVKDMLKRKFHDNPNFVMMKSRIKHEPGDVVILND